MFDEDPDMLYSLAMEMKGQERFGICFDYAHATVFGQNIDMWADKLLPFTKHIHINDNNLNVDITRVLVKEQSTGGNSTD